MLIINIPDILKKYTDVDHRLSPEDIIEILWNEYSMKADVPDMPEIPRE